MQRSGGEPDPGWGEASRYAAHLDRGWDQFDRGALDAARRSAEEAHRVRPDDPDAPYLLGQVAAAQGRSREALVWYERAAEADPSFPAPLVAAALVSLYDVGDHAQALAYAERALALETLGVIDALEMHLVAAEAERRGGAAMRAVARLSEMPEAETLEAACRLLALHREQPDVPPPAPDAIADPAVADATGMLFFDADGERLDEEEYEGVCQRLLDLGIRLGRLWQGLDRPEAAAHVARLLVHGFPDVADAWYALAEAHMVGGEPQTAVHAALRSALLEQDEPISDFVPDADALRGEVVELLGAAPHPALRELVERAVPVFVHVADRVPPELLLDGVDPRAPVLALGPRGAQQGQTIMGIAIYRRGLAFHAGYPEGLGDVLRELLYDEVALALALPEDERKALLAAGTPSGDGGDDPDDGQTYDA